MSVAGDLTSRCSWAGAQAARLAAEARDVYQLGNLVLRGGPFALGCFAGWLFTEFPPHVLTGHALSRVSHPSIGRVGKTLAAQRADHTLTAALQESLGPDFRDQVCHPTSVASVCARRGGLLGRPGRTAATRRRLPTSPTVRAGATTCWTSGGATTWRPAAAHRC
ncbi:carboxylesterase family domain protein [Mycobacterium avium subsp. avium 2285 (R)]|nr:carboxylesterase family domain protein [Mycobacterium avium subsp. avium 2285 (R)]